MPGASSSSAGAPAGLAAQRTLRQRVQAAQSLRRRRVPAILTQAAPSQIGTAEITIGRRVQAAVPSPFGGGGRGAESRRCREKAAAQVARLQSGVTSLSRAREAADRS